MSEPAGGAAAQMDARDTLFVLAHNKVLGTPVFAWTVLSFRATLVVLREIRQFRQVHPLAPLPRRLVLRNCSGFPGSSEFPDFAGIPKLFEFPEVLSRLKTRDNAIYSVFHQGVPQAELLA